MYEFKIKIDGLSDPTLSADIIKIEVDTNVFLPGMFSILINDDVSFPLQTLKYTDNMLRFRIGASVEISMSKEDLILPIPAKNTIMKGEITAIEPVYDDNGEVMLRIRGFDRSHRLTLGKNTRTFGDGNPIAATVTDSQIVSLIARNAGLIPKVDMSGLGSVRYHYVMQYNQNDWDFLWARAQLLGYQVYVDNKTLNFVKAGAKRELIGPSTLNWGEDLTRFEPRLVSMGAVTAVEAVGWDSDKKKQISASSNSHSSNTVASINDPLKGSKAIKLGFFSSAEDAVLDTAIKTDGMARAVAQAKFAEHESHFVRARGETRVGDPFLVAGSVVKIENVGKRFEGSYYVTEAKHIWYRGDYTVKFKVSGRNPYTIRHLLLGRDPNLNKVQGVVIGVVTNTQDPEKLGRVQVQFPWMPKYKGAELGSNWARVVVLGGGKERGIYFSPEVDDEVLIAFENGDVNFPYIMGALWNKKDKPPEGANGNAVDGSGKVNERIVRSRSGHVIILDDTQGSERITIMDKTEKNSIVIDSKDNSMMIRTAGDLTIETGGKFIVNSTKDIAMDTKAKAEITAQTQMNFEGKTSAKLKGGMSELDLQAAAASIKGTKVDVQATAQASVKGNAMVEIQGGIVKIN